MRKGDPMTAVADERAKLGYGLGSDEGEAYWLLGMLETIKIGGADTGGAYGLLEIEVRPGEGSPWHVHPEEDEWFYVLEGHSSPSTSATPS
jgi:quercetin dioxygenase-like cupin family protein